MDWLASYVKGQNTLCLGGPKAEKGQLAIPILAVAGSDVSLVERCTGWAVTWGCLLLGAIASRQARSKPVGSERRCVLWSRIETITLH